MRSRGKSMPPGTPRTDPATRRMPPVRTLEEWRRAARRFLDGRIESPGREADLMARHVLGLRQVDLPLLRDRELAPAERRKLSGILHKRARRVPLQYLLGEVEFHGVTLAVGPGVLIPRPETEGLVDRVLAYLDRTSPGPVVDVGTGSGAIALAVARRRPRAEVWATEVSAAALRIARANARRLGLAGRVRFRAGDLLSPVEGREPGIPFRVVVSNPPYVSPRDKERLAPEIVEHEPGVALFSEEGGTGVIRRLAPAAAHLLAPGGLLALEIGEEQGETVRRLLEASGAWTGVRIEPDLAGRDRYALGIRI